MVTTFLCALHGRTQWATASGARCWLLPPPDIHARFERARGNKVLMVSGSDEHGTPITVTAEQDGVSPQDVVDEYHAINTKALLDLGCTWMPNVDSRGIDYGGSLFNRTSDSRHKEKVQENFRLLYNAGFFEKRTMQQYFEVHPDGGGRFLPDRYIEGTCPSCGADGARGDQCDACGATYESSELKNPVSKMNPELKVEIRDTDHLFYRLDLFQEALEQHAENNHAVWKPNVRAMTKQWLDMGLRPGLLLGTLNGGLTFHSKARNGMVNASMSGSKQFKDILHVLRFGLNYMVTVRIGNNGGSKMKNPNNVIITSLVRTTCLSIL